MFKQALRMTARDWRAGQLRFLLVALVVAVAAMSAAGFFIDRLRAGLNRDAHQLLGADMVAAYDNPIPAAWREEALRRGLRVAQTMAFPSMAQAGEGDAARSVLVSLKAVSAEYPLRGRVKVNTDLAQASESIGTPAPAAPAAGTVWIDPSLAGTLEVAIGGTLQLGDKQFRVTQLIAAEPDRGGGFINFAPRVFVPLSDMAATNLVQEGSRIGYRLLVAGNGASAKPAQEFGEWLRALVKKDNVRGVRIESLEEGRPEMNATLDRADRFLSLVGLLSAMLAAVAVAMAARRFMQRHLDSCAMLRCLGLTQNQVTVIYLVEFLLVGLAGSALGVLVGFGAHYVLIELLGSLVGADIPPPSLLPALQGLATGLLLLAGFALPPILQLRNVPHNRVIRREQAAPKPAALATYGLGIAAFGALLLWQSNDVKLAAMTGGGFLAGFGLFALVAWLGLQALRPLRNVFPQQAWRFAVTSLRRRPGATVVQVVSLSLGLMALLLLTVVRGDLMTTWRNTMPPDAPNRFIINIQPDQKDAIASRLQAAGVKELPLYPMIRGRLLAVNGKVITRDTYSDERARGLAEREFNLSTMTELPAQNQVTAGKWAMQGQAGEASVEEGLAKTLGLKLGDSMRFDIAGSPVEAKITSLRKLEWGSMRVNFFVILNPAVMADTPQTYITAFHMPAGGAQAGTALSRAFPNLTIIDVGGVVRQVQTVLEQVIQAVEFLFAFTLLSGVLVLYAALMGSQDERRREAGLLRALGATRRQLSQAQLIEFMLVGGVGGLLAATGAGLMGWGLATYQFKFPWTISIWVWVAGLVAGALCAVIGGWLGLRNVLNHPPLQTLREA
ncbi:FtsX-like permease family protein [Pseudoduganella sp. DS3]|uniref:FtsX-like permease family protein n=1 Tax=Pseudoduganella guangdongensis TaxID=2692179 RepID=A0A6N9HEE4_9BURK|nr:FtsX-like permease family protein [Pseudoduganella guangdongensis]MYN01826.1 FtsX-like permease family protein [Pseudoduganella guangdongensis]